MTKDERDEQVIERLLVQDPGVDDAAPEHAEQACQIELGRRLHGCPRALSYERHAH